MDKDTKGRPRNGLLTTKQAEYQAPGKCGIFSLFCCLGFPKGLTPWHTTLLAKCSVLYALSALLRKWGCRRGRASTFEAAGKQGCDCVAWSCKRRVGFISRQGVYESPRPSSYAGLRTKCPELVDTLTKKQTDFPLKIEMDGKPF